MSHSAAIRGKHACRLFQGRAKGVLWRHSSVNLVKPRHIALGRAKYSSANAEDRHGG